MNVASYLKAEQCPFEKVTHSPAYGARGLAEELHLPHRDVVKTVLLRGPSEGEYVVAVFPANKRVDLDAVSQVLGGKVELGTDLEVAERCSDCEFGILSPFGSRYGMRTLMDTSVEAPEILFEGNTRSEAIRMRLAEYSRLEKPLIARFAVHDCPTC